MTSAGKILVTREQIAAAGGIKAALDEAHSLAALQLTPRFMTAYEAVGSAPTEADGAGAPVQIEVQNEQELREALDAGAQAVQLVEMSMTEARRLAEIAQSLRGDCLVEVRAGDSRNNA
jgi:hypothetical protein